VRKVTLNRSSRQPSQDGHFPHRVKACGGVIASNTLEIAHFPGTIPRAGTYLVAAIASLSLTPRTGTRIDRHSHDLLSETPINRKDWFPLASLESWQTILFSK
jgi:hypothetical protein